MDYKVYLCGQGGDVIMKPGPIMPKYAQVCPSMLKYVQVCSSMPKYA